MATGDDKVVDFQTELDAHMRKVGRLVRGEREPRSAPLPSYDEIMADVAEAEGEPMARFSQAMNECEAAIIEIAGQFQVCERCLVGSLVVRLQQKLQNGIITHVGGPDDGPAA